MFDFFQDFSVRIKLILLLVITFLSLSIFSSAYLYAKYNDYQKSKDNLTTLVAIKKLLVLVHASQEERELKMIYVSNFQEKDLQNLLAQRLVTKQIMEEMAVYLDSKQLADLQQPALLLSNPSAEDVGGVFQEYTLKIADYLNLIDRLKITLKDEVLLRKSSALNNLNYLQEYAGKERDLLKRVFETKLVTGIELNNILKIIAVQERMHKHFRNTANDIYIDLLDKNINASNLKQFYNIRKAMLNKIDRLEYLNELQKLIGYGGLIHDFQSYIRDGNKDHLIDFDEHYLEVLNLFEKFKSLQGVSTQEFNYIEEIEMILALYAKRVTAAQDMYKEGLSQQEIYFMAYTDDDKALKALDALYGDIVKVDAIDWWDLSTLRIDAIHAVQETLLLNMMKQAEFIKKDSFTQLSYLLALMLFTIVTSSYLSFLLLRRIRDVVIMSRQVQKMRETGNYEKPLGIFNTDEVSQLSFSFNSLMTEKNEYEAKMWHQAHHDQLTGLPNRHYFLQLIKQAINKAKEEESFLSVLFFDLDRFKYINDTLGHQAGDELLSEVANRIESLKLSDDVLARLGGDEFVLIQPSQNNNQQSSNMADDILKALNKPFTLSGNKQVVISTSIGISVYPKDALNSSCLIKHADIAMYQSKAEGKNTYCYFDIEMQLKLEASSRTEIELKQAQINNEFELYYQPVFDIENQKMVAVEALIRWNHPKKGIVFPDQFISVLEETNLIIETGDWVIETAIKQIASFNKQYKSQLEIAVNLSSRQCLDRFRTLYPRLKKLSNLYSFDLNLLHIELTESILIDNSAEMIMGMKKITALGVKFHLDDFGTGFSSLSYLKSFPMSLVKIDRSFIKNLPYDDENKMLSKAIINLAEGLNLEVLAEGVETKEQMDLVQSMGCNLIQGYYISKPIPFKDCASFIVEKNGLKLT